MRKDLFIILIASFFSHACIAQNRGTEAVSKFGDNISNWCRYTKDEYKKAAIDVSAGERGCLVYDSLMLEFERRKNREILKNYRLSDYLLAFEQAIYEGTGINVVISNIKEETNVKFDNASMLDEKRNSLYYVSCNVNVSGVVNFTSKDLFCIRKGSGLISQIAPFVGVQDPGSTRENPIVNTSHMKDWDHIADGEFNSIEFSYGYSKNFPLNVGLAASISYFNLGLEYGQNLDKEPIITKEHTNFASSQINGKYFYLMASPGVFLRFATISYGFGATMAKYYYESVYDSYNKNKTYFTMKPKVAFNLPLPVDFKSRKEKCYLCPYVGYLFAPKFSKINNLEFGIGLRFRFND